MVLNAVTGIWKLKYDILMKEGRFLQLFVFFLLMFFICSSCRKVERYVPVIGEPFTDFDIKDIDGVRINSINLKGKIFIIEFWATWCEPCRVTIPFLSSIQTKYKDKGMEIIAISLDEDMNNVRMKDFVREYSIPYRVVIADNSIRKKFNIYMVPTIFLVDRNGILVNIYRGYIPDMEEILVKEIEGLL